MASIAVELEYKGFGTYPSGEMGGSYRKSFEVEWPRIPTAGEFLRIGEGNAPIYPVKGVTFGVDGTVTLWFDEIERGAGMDETWLDQNGWTKASA